MYKILIVDDENKSRERIADLLALLSPDSKIVQSEHPFNALRLMNEINFDLLFVDVVMPQMNGLEMIEKARQAGKNPYVVLISAFDEFKYAQGGMEVGASAYILKPYTQERVAQVLRNYRNKMEQPDNLPFILFNKGYGNFPLKIKDIVAIERSDRFRINIYTTTEYIRFVTGTLAEMRSKLPSYFTHINRQCMVNLVAIKRFNTKNRKIYFNQGAEEISFFCSRENMKKIAALLSKDS